MLNLYLLEQHIETHMKETHIPGLAIATPASLWQGT